MICYFTDRKLKIIGQASTNLESGSLISDDLKTEDVESGSTSLSLKVHCDDSNRSQVEWITDVGNYILKSNGHDDADEVYVIVEQETATDDKTVYVYAEDAGLDLLNEICFIYPDIEMGDDEDPHPITYYVNKWISGGFEIGICEVPDSETKACTFDSEQTVLERLHDLAGEFGCEISFSFSVDKMAINHKYVNIFTRRGTDTAIQLRLGREVNAIRTKKSLANIATALYCTGATKEGSNIAGTFSNLDSEPFQYDDGEFYIDGNLLKSRSALAKWGRYYNDGSVEYQDDIIKRFSFDTLDPAVLCQEGIKELTKLKEPEINYEVDIAKLPEGLNLGDRVYVVDDRGGLYLSARLLKLETSVSEMTITAVLGDYLIKSSGISERIEAMAAEWKEIANRPIPQPAVEISVDSINTDTNVATIKATLRIDGVVKSAKSYQWYKDRVPITGAQTQTLTIDDLEGVYSCVVTYGD